MNGFRPNAARAAAVFVLLAATLGGSGCVTPGPKLVTPKPPAIPKDTTPVPAHNIAVLGDGQQLVANAAWGRIKIEAGPGLRRVYTWNGMRRGAILRPRTDPFAGADTLGLYYNGKPPIWASADGITKLHVEEGEHRFDNMDDALIWMQIRRLRYTYNDDGIVVGWRPQGDTLRVELWQFYIDGKKPTSMPKARNQAIAMGPTHVVPQPMQPALVYADGHRTPVPQNWVVTGDTAHPPAATRTASITTGPRKKNWFQKHITDPIAGLFGGGKKHATELAHADTPPASEQKPTPTTVAVAAEQAAPTAHAQATDPSATRPNADTDTDAGASTPQEAAGPAKSANSDAKADADNPAPDSDAGAADRKPKANADDAGAATDKPEDKATPADS